MSSPERSKKVAPPSDPTPAARIHSRLPKDLAPGLSGTAAGIAKMLADLNAAGTPMKSFGAELHAARGFSNLASSPVLDEIRRTLERSQEMRAISTRAAELARLPSPELQTARSVRDQTAQLVQVTTATGEHIAEMAAIAATTLEQLAAMQLTAAEALEESRQVRSTLAKASADQRRSGSIIIGLTFVIAVLTVTLVVLSYLLVADQLHLWPFPGVSTSGTFP